MVKTLHPQLDYSLKQDKDSKFSGQILQVFDAFFKQPLTMKELSVLTGIDRANVCWYCRLFRAAGLISIYQKGYCTITKHRANRYTTNPELFPVSSQLKLF